MRIQQGQVKQQGHVPLSIGFQQQRFHIRQRQRPTLLEIRQLFGHRQRSRHKGLLVHQQKSKV